MGRISIGALYSNGKGVKQNYLNAKKLFKKACDSNYTFACKNIKLKSWEKMDEHRTIK